VAKAAARNGGPRPVGGESSGVSPGRIARAEPDRLLHERVRLAMVSALAAQPALTFVELKELLGTTDGNLSVHARKLEEAGYVVCSKAFAGRVPRTEYRLTADGRRSLERYVDHLEALVKELRPG
jgi:DNA-binding transcriptional ArsR family regulator